MTEKDYLRNMRNMIVAIRIGQTKSIFSRQNWEYQFQALYNL